MKKFVKTALIILGIILVGNIVVLTSAVTDEVEKDKLTATTSENYSAEDCEIYRDFAKQVMTNRQSGLPKDEYLDQVRSMSEPETHDVHRFYIDWAYQSAYDPDTKDTVIEEFGESVYRYCRKL